tara:strand:+ start:389 stop:673 length:285 start_codon:yes stop_codon:yes gene_type:complete
LTVIPWEVRSLLRRLASLRPYWWGRKIKSTAQAADIDLSPYQIVATPHSHAAAKTAVQLVHEGKVEALMKGNLHTDELMTAVVDKTKGLRTGGA